MTRLVHTVQIARPPEEVLRYASTAARWPEWHPSSLEVVGSRHPLVAGERFEEDIRAGGREGHLSWNVLEAVPGTRWRATAIGEPALELLLTYEVHASGSGTRFVRTLEYQLGGLLMRIADVLVLRRRIERESSESLRILRDVIERDGASPESVSARP
jgi:uncharacterized protein YndB with AHSA1/START domain